MHASEFLDVLAAKGLLPEKLIASLRSQVAASKKPVTAEAIAKLLISKGQLTSFQAEQLLAGGEPATGGDSPGEELGLTPLEEETPAGDDLGLAPLDDEAPSPAPSPAADEGLALTPLDDEPAPSSANPAAPESATTKPPAAEAPAAAAPSLLEEELGDLGGGETPLEGLLDDPLAAEGGLEEAGSPLAPARRKKGLGRFFKRKKSAGAAAKKKAAHQSQWESPVILAGGGLLVFLVLLGAVLLYVLNRGGGDQQFQLAEEDYRGGSYSQAIGKYNTFLEKYPNHPEASLARVRVGLARMRQNSGDPSQGLAVAREVLGEIDDEEQFAIARDELRSILPDIAEGLAQKAQTDGTPEAMRGAVAEAREALVLCANTKYVPKKYRPVQRMESIEAMLGVVDRELARDTQLDETLATMAAATAEGETARAYAVRTALLKKYPDLAENVALAESVQKVAAAEASRVEVTEPGTEPLREEVASPVVAALALANRRGPGTSSAEPGAVTVVRAGGAAYGLDAAGGRLLWRRGVGAERDEQAWPVPAGQGVLLVDRGHDELVQVAAANGMLAWRQPIGGWFAPPVVTGPRAVVAVEAGKVLAIDLASGKLLREASIPQELRTSPAVHPQKPILYQAGSHSTLYVLSADDLACRETYYLGHAAGTVEVPPVVALHTLIVAENFTTSAARLHVLRLDAEGGGLTAAQQIRLTGHVVTPPVVFGRRVAVATDRGEVKVFEVGTASADGPPLTQVAERVASAGEPLLRRLLVENDRLWIADRLLARFAVQASSGRLVPQATEAADDGDLFLGPLTQLGDVLLHVRQRQGAAGVTISAVDMREGRKLWETDLAMRPAGPPLVDTARRSLTAVTADGTLFQFDAAALQARVQDQPLPQKGPAGAELAGRVDLPEGRVAFVPDAGGKHLLLLDPAGKPRWIALDAELTCQPVALGKGLVAPLANGQVVLLDGAGKPLAAPFQPRLEAGQLPVWRRPGVIESDPPQLIVSDGGLRLFRVGIKAEPARHLAELASSETLAEALRSPVAVVGEKAVAVDALGRLQAFGSDDLQAAGTHDLPGQAVWGPRRVGEGVLLVNDREELIRVAADGSIAWRQPLTAGPLAGATATPSGDYLLASVDGTLWQVAAASGEEQARVDLGQPLASRPVAFGPRWIVATPDGALLVVSPLKGA